MHSILQVSEQKKLSRNIKISSILIQFTYLAFPLSMYIVYNKIIANNNPTAITVVAIFLLIIITIQLLLKIIDTINKNILKADILIQEHQDYLTKKLNTQAQPSIHNFNTSELTSISKKSSHKIQSDISSNYLIFLLIYFILLITVGGFIIIIPAIFLGLNYVIAITLNNKHDDSVDKYNAGVDYKTRFLKEVFAKYKELKGLNITDYIINKYDYITFNTNKHKCHALYYKNLLLKISAIISMLNIAFILIFGRLLHSYNLISMQEIIACSLLTVWISRSSGQIFLNLSSVKLKSDNNDLPTNHDYNNTKELSDKLRNKPRPITTDHFQQIQNHLKDHPIVYWKQTHNTSLYSLKKMYKNNYVSISYIDNNFKLFYGSILDNVTLFNPSRYENAIKMIEKFDINHLVNNLPYQLNYVTTGTNDEAIPYDLILTIMIIRELLKKPDLIILDINSDEISIQIRRALITYIKENNIKLILKQNNFNDKLNAETKNIQDPK